MSLNQAQAEALQQEGISEVLVYLVTVTSSEMAAPLRLTSDGTPTTSRGEVYIPAVMDVSPVDELPDEQPKLRAVIGLPDATLSKAIRAIDEAPAIVIEWVFLSDPDAVLITTAALTIVSATISVQQIVAELGAPSLYESVGPKRFYTPDVAPGLYR